MPAKRPVPVETLEERWLFEAQTARNLEGLTAEQEGRQDDAVALYERNVAEGFTGDWPYGRLVAIYEKRGQLGDAERVLLRAMEVTQAATRRTPQDRRAMLLTFKKRLGMARKRMRAEAAEARRRG